MTDKPDTSTEAVERLADQAMAYGGAHSFAADVATTLRTLAAERDALRAEVAAHSEERMGWNKMLNAARRLKNSLTEKLTKAEAEVAALRQAVERARGEALEEAAGIAEAPLRSLTYGGCRTAYEMVARAIRARRGCGQ